MKQNLLTKEGVVKAAQSHLDRLQADGYDLHVLSEETKQDSDWWYIAVKPSQQPKKMYAYYEALAGVESDMMDEDHVNVFFVPVLPDEA